MQHLTVCLVTLSLVSWHILALYHDDSGRRAAIEYVNIGYHTDECFSLLGAVVINLEAICN